MSTSAPTGEERQETATAPGLRGRLAPLLPALRTVGFVAAVGIVVVIGVRAALDYHPGQLTWWPLPLALAAAVGWWLLLARGWALLVTGHATAKDLSAWCRTQTLRFLPGGVWAPASRATVVKGSLLDKLSTVAAENVIALCAALAVGGVAFAASGEPLWLPLILALTVPALAARLVADRTRLAPARTRRATVNYFVAFLGYALAAVLVQGAVSGFHDPFAIAGAAAVAWAAGLAVVFAPGGVGVRELAYVGLLSGTLPSGQLAAGAVTMRIVTIVAELGVLVVVGRPQSDGASVRQALSSGAAFARRHALFLSLLCAGAALRVVTWLAYQPALLIYDSQSYLADAVQLRPPEVRPLGYSVLLWILHTSEGLATVPAAQHAMGLVIAVLIYTLLLRLGVRRWAAALAAAPVLLDAYQLVFEQHVLSEALFELLVIAGCTVLLWQRRPGIVAASVAGLLFAASALTREVGIVAIAPALLTLLCLRWSTSPAPRSDARRAGARLVQAGLAAVRALRPGLPAAAAMLVAFAMPLVAYAVWFHSVHGTYAITDYGGRFFYARVAPFANCSKFSVPRDERVLCPTQPVGKRPTLGGSTSEYYMWDRASPLRRIAPKSRSRLAGDFAKRVVLHQPRAYLRAVTHDFLRGFALTRTTGRGELSILRWRFQPGYPIYLPNTADIIRRNGGGRGRADRSLTPLLRDYQRFGFVPGPLLALGLIAGLLAGLGVGRARRSGLRSASLLFAVMGFGVFAATVVSNQFSWRYQLPMIVLLPPAAALGLTALLRHPQASPAEARAPDEHPPERAAIGDPAAM
ncbi:MAG: hypothetical protein QOD76_790 [Solirubrobacteraceae bacterium]|nr:hypothetical protein [Solirubrobacteraceae bacterium]